MIGGTIPLARRLTPLSKKKLMNLYKIYCKVKFKEKRDENVNQIIQICNSNPKSKNPSANKKYMYIQSQK